MNRPVRITLITGGVVAALVLILAGASFFLLRSAWLREKLRATIVEQAEIATGGRVEIGKFNLEWGTLTADVDKFVLHGTEAPDQAPLLAVDRVTVGFKVISLLSRNVRLDHIDVLRPHLHLIVDEAGETNLPKPKTHSKKNTADSILDLKIGRFEVRDGDVLAESPGATHIYPWSGNGRNLEAKAAFDAARDRYAGSVSLAPLHLTLGGGYGPLDVDVHASAALERNRITISSAQIKSAASEVNLTDMVVGPFTNPAATAKYNVAASAAEVIRVLHGKSLLTTLAGHLNVTGNARYATGDDFTVNGTFHGSDLVFDGVRNIRIAGTVAGTQKEMELTSIRVNALGGDAALRVDLNGYETYKVAGTVSRLGVRDLAALGTKQSLPYDGLVSGDVEAHGVLRELARGVTPDATTFLTVTPARSGPAVRGEISAHYAGSAAKIEMGHSWLELPHTRVDVNGTLGAELTVKLETKDLNDLTPALNGHTLPFTLRNGSASFAGTVTGALASPYVAGHVAAQNAVFEDHLIDSVAGDVTASASQATATNAVATMSGITANGGGQISLADWAATDASVILGNAVATNVDLTHALDVAKQKNDSFTGTVTAEVRLSGTLGQPVGNADVTLIKGLIYQQPYDSVTARVQYINPDRQNVSGIFVSGPKRVNFDANYQRAAGQVFPVGTLQVTANSNSMALNQIALVRERQPDIQGSAEFHGNAAVRITRDAKDALHLNLAGLNGDGTVTGIGLDGRELGDAHFKAATAGMTVTMTFDSNAAKAVITGRANIDLAGDNHATGSIAFSNADLKELATLATSEKQVQALSFDGIAEGRIDFNGPILAPKDMSATATIQQIELHPLPNSPLAKTIPGFSLHNVGPMRFSLDKSVLRVEAAHVQAPETDMSLTGTAEFSGSSPLNLRMQGDVNLAMLRNFVPDLASSGSVAINGTVRGGWSSPDVAGRATMSKGEFHYSDFNNGLTNATSEIVFSGNRANIVSFNADTGGGKFTGTGFATLTNGNVAFQFSAKTRDVRLRYPQGVSSISDSDIQLIRTPQRSGISGTVTVRRLVINPQQDAEVMLADMSQSVLTPAEGDSIFANMNLDIVIQTSPDVALQSKVAQSIQADASLRLRGTVSSPALLGRVNVSQGEVLFLGNKYTISQGSISFVNPTKIEPILNADLQTKARGVDVTLTVTGPPTHLGMTYRSDPPLEFADIVALLATGRTPDDPSVALRGNGPTQSFEQLGASALLGQALANPVAGRLQRFFGVSRLKIDPQLSGVGGTPGAKLTVEQQVTPDILFTYITDVSNTSQQLIRVEWAFNQHWSAILERAENGYVGLDFAYKKRFK